MNSTLEHAGYIFNFTGRGECADIIRNAMAWFALEEVARELNPDL